MLGASGLRSIWEDGKDSLKTILLQRRLKNIEQLNQWELMFKVTIENKKSSFSISLLSHDVLVEKVWYILEIRQ